MAQAVKIAPSILSADFSRLGAEIEAIEAAGADWIHVDVMDGHFVPNITIGPPVVKALRPHAKKPFDCHLMIAPVDPYLDAFADAGCDGLTVHPESGPHVHRTLQHIRKLGKKAGVVLNPGTPVDALDNLMDLVDLILVMTVNPGFGGQTFIESQLAKIEGARKRIDQSGRAIELEVDGGITPETAKRAVAAGATVLVAGTSVFQGGPSRYADDIQGLERLTVGKPQLLALLPELIRAFLRRAATPLRIWWRRGFFYRRLLKGQLADHIVFHPWDAAPRRLEEADGLLRGRFRFHGVTVEVPPGVSVFDIAPPSPAWAEALHGFHWLPALSMAGGDNARKLATNLIGQWVKRHARYSEPAWLPHIMALRLANIFSHGRLVVVNSEMMWRSRLFVSLREQCRMLERISGEAPDGLKRLEAAAVLALSGLCLDDSPKRRTVGLERLEAEIARQILPDGGHVSRSPQALLSAYRHIIMVLEALSALGEEPPHGLRNAHDRMAPMLRFFRHADGALALFNGGLEGDPRMIAGILARDDVRGQPFQHARHSGYQRLSAGRTLVLLDCGKAPQGAFSLEAHAGAGAFELSSGHDRIVVNCGAGGLAQPNWNAALRASAAHSTLILADSSSAQILPAGLARDLLDPRLVDGPKEPVSRRVETAQGWAVEAMHDGYADSFGLRHERQVTMSPQGLMVTGRDRLVPVTADAPGAGQNFAVRFHIHPDVRVSRLEGGGFLLKLPGGEGWRFRAGGGTLAVEESVYLGGPAVRRTEQLVISGITKAAPAEIAWVFEQIVA